MDSDARLTRDEVDEVLTRATRLTDEEDVGLTVQELHEVAEEAGIPSEALSEALREISRSAAAERLTVKRWIRQRDTAFIPVSVSDAELALLLRLLDRLGQIRGGVSHEAGAIRWKSAEGHAVEVFCRPAETQVAIETELQPSLLEVAGGAFWTWLLVVVTARMAPDAAWSLIGGAIGLASIGVYLKLKAAKLRESATKSLAGISDALRLVAGKE